MARDREVLRIRSVTLRMRLLIVGGVPVSLIEFRPRRFMLGLAVEARGRIGDMFVSSGGGGGGPGVLDGSIVPVSADMAMLISPVLVRVWANGPGGGGGGGGGIARWTSSGRMLD